MNFFRYKAKEEPTFQSFRLVHSSSPAVIARIKTVYRQDLNQHVVYLTDVLDQFPVVHKINHGDRIRIKHGDRTLLYLKDRDNTEIMPHCIAPVPGAVLDVIVGDSPSELSVPSPLTRFRQRRVLEQDDSSQSTYQSFRLAGSPGYDRIVKIATGYREDLRQHVVLLGDVQDRFPGHRFVLHEDKILPFLRDGDHNVITPHCIASVPGVVLDVVVEDSPSDPSVPSPPSDPLPLSIASPSSVPSSTNRMTNTQNKSEDSITDKDSSIKLSDTEERESGLKEPRNANQALIPTPAVVDTNLTHQHPEPIPKLRSEKPQQGVQAIHLPSRNKTVHIASHFDSSSGNEIILWSDVLVVFRGALYLQHGTKVISFLKGNDFRDLDPLRITCVPEVTLDVVLEDAPTDSGTHSPSPQQMELLADSPHEVPQTPTVSRGRSPHGHMELALANYSHMEAPRADLRGPQLCSNNNEDNSVSVSPSR